MQADWERARLPGNDNDSVRPGPISPWSRKTTNFLPPPGTAYEDLETPQLVIDLPAMEHNIETLHRFFRGRPARVRSVTKGHKCPAIAQRQMTTDGAVPFGLCCAKVSEAEVMVAAGARHIRLIEQVVGKVKIERLMNLARSAQVIALVDDPRHVADLAGAAEAHGLTLDVLVEVEIGLNRGPDYARSSSRSGGLAKAVLFPGSRASLPADGARSVAFASLPRAGSPRSQEADGPSCRSPDENCA